MRPITSVSAKRSIGNTSLLNFRSSSPVRSTRHVDLVGRDLFRGLYVGHARLGLGAPEQAADPRRVLVLEVELAGGLGAAGVGCVDVEVQLGPYPAARDDDPIDAHQHHRRQQLMTALGELAAGGGHEQRLDGVVVDVTTDVDTKIAGVVRRRLVLSGGIPSCSRRFARRVDGDMARIPRNEVVASLVVRDVVGHELIDGLGDVGEQLTVRLHLLDRRRHDRLERPRDQVGHEVREIDRIEGVLASPRRRDPRLVARTPTDPRPPERAVG